MYIYLNIYQQMTEVKFLGLRSSIWNQFTLSKNVLRSFKILSRKYVYISKILSS